MRSVHWCMRDDDRSDMMYKLTTLYGTGISTVNIYYVLLILYWV